MLKNNFRLGLTTFATIVFAIGLSSCKQNTGAESSYQNNNNSGIKANSGYEATYLVADIAGFGNARIDANLQNGWGIAISKSGYFWISANHSGTSVIYDKDGAQVRPAVDIPSRTSATGAADRG